MAKPTLHSGSFLLLGAVACSSAMPMDTIVTVPPDTVFTQVFDIYCS